MGVGEPLAGDALLVGPGATGGVGQIVYYDARVLPGATLGLSNDILAVSLALTIATAPFMIPFTLRDVDREDDIEWD